MAGQTENPICRLYWMGKESVEHLWLECDALQGLRMRDQLGVTMAKLLKQPKESWTMLGNILSSVDLGDYNM